MSQILVVWVGRRPGRQWESLLDEYQQRVARHVAISQVRVRPEEGRDRDPRRALAAEAGRVRSHLRPGDTLVVLDEGGRERRSEELARWLADHLERGRLVLVVGSDLGLDEGLRSAAHEALSLSWLTLPHALARLLLLEQLYRAADILAGGAYHRS